MARSFVIASNQYLTASGVPASPYPLTMACWFRTSNSAHQALFAISDEDAVEYVNIVARGAVSRVWGQCYDGAVGTSISTGTYTPGNWSHACHVLRNSTDRSIFVNGGGEGTNAVDVSPANLSGTSIGAMGSNSAWEMYTEGSVAEAAIWNVALNDDEVATLAEGVSPLLVRPQSLVMYVPLIRDDDEDIVGGLSFTANGGPTVSAHCRVILPGVALHYAPAAAAGISIPVVMHHLRQQEVA